MTRLIFTLLLVFLLPGCATVASLRPAKGETPCDFGKRVMGVAQAGLDEAQRRLDQARTAADVLCPPPSEPVQ